MEKIKAKQYKIFCCKWRTMLTEEFPDGFIFNKKNKAWLKERADGFDIMYATYLLLWTQNPVQAEKLMDTVLFDVVPYDLAYKKLMYVLNNGKLLLREIKALARKYPL